MTLPPSSRPGQRTRRSFKSTLRGKHRILLSWLITNPFVTSFVEDQSRGTAKETRTNTLRNRDTSPLPPSPDTVVLSGYETYTDSSLLSSQSLASLPSVLSASRRTISFSTKVKVYSLEDPETPFEEDVKEPSMRPPLEARTRPRSMPCLDVHQPNTAAGQWLLRKTSDFTAYRRSRVAT